MNFIRTTNAANLRVLRRFIVEKNLTQRRYDAKNWDTVHGDILCDFAAWREELFFGEMDRILAFEYGFPLSREWYGYIWLGL